jgi:hypothetical protein
MTAERLAEIAARAAAATPGPWCADGWEIYRGAEYVGGAKWIGETCRPNDTDGAVADAEFIAHAPEDVAALLAEVERLRKYWMGAVVTVSEQAERLARRDRELDAERQSVAQLRAELTPYEMLSPQICAAGKHQEWLVDSEYGHACPWCEIERLTALLQDSGALPVVEELDGCWRVRWREASPVQRGRFFRSRDEADAWMAKLKAGEVR